MKPKLSPKEQLLKDFLLENFDLKPLFKVGTSNSKDRLPLVFEELLKSIEK